MYEIFPAIVAVGYNRIECMKRLVRSVENAAYPEKTITLIVSIDFSDKSDEIERAVREVGWSHGDLIIKKYKERLGLRNHIIKCGDLSEDYGAVIILEDDLIVSQCYYNYVLQALRFYKNDHRIVGISLYSHAWNGYSNYEFIAKKNVYDSYMGQFSITWGQCWTKEEWKKFKIWYEAKNKEGLSVNFNLPENIECWGDKSWGKYFVYYIVEKDLYYIIPYISLSTNCSEAGEHNNIVSSSHQVMILDAVNMDFRFPTFKQAIKYDIFFERVIDKELSINGIHIKDICFDLNGCHRDSNGCRYLLTSIKEDSLQPIKTYGLQLRPIEENIIHEVPGDSLFLYYIPEGYERRRVKKVSYDRMRYELYDHEWKRILKYGFISFLYAIKRKIGGKFQ